MYRYRLREVLGVLVALFAPVIVVAAVIGAPNSPMTMGPAVDASTLMRPAIGSTDVRTKPVSSTNVAQRTTADNRGSFRTSCKPSHMAFDDPLVAPGRPGASHLHLFFGNDSTDAYSTVAGLASAGGSTCPGGVLNRSAYWVPAMIDQTAVARVPLANEVYYKFDYYLSPGQHITAPPAGLRMLAGDMRNTAPGSATTFRFACAVGGPAGTDHGWHNTIPSCPAGSQLWAQVFFPQCWDGANLDSLDHKSHTARPVRGFCPADHPVALPLISYNIEYAVNAGDDTTQWRLSSDMASCDGGGWGCSMHGDVIEAWDAATIQTWTDNCLNGAATGGIPQDCHNELLGDGRTLY